MPLYEGSMAFHPSQILMVLMNRVEFGRTPLTDYLKVEERKVTHIKGINKTIRILGMISLFLLHAKFVFAEATSEADLSDFLTGVGDFLINTVAGPLFIIGICLAGAAVIFGDTRTAQKFGFVALGGAIMLLSRALLDILERLTNF